MAVSSKVAGQGWRAVTEIAVLSALLAMTATVVKSTPAFAEDTRQWLGETQEGGAVLVYGLPQSDDSPVSFRCEMPAHDFIVTLALDPDFEPKTGAVRVTVKAPPAEDQLTFDAEIQYLQEADLTFLEARPAFDASVARMLKQGKELQFVIGETTFSYPLAGAAEAMGPLEAACSKPT